MSWDDWSNERPWERPGALRRDCEPHRGETFRSLGVGVLACAALGSCLGAPAVAGLALGVVVWLAARRDRRLMAAARMDPAGEAATWDAQSMAAVGTALCLLAAAAWVVALLKVIPH
jgi:hypothetical protein